MKPTITSYLQKLTTTFGTSEQDKEERRKSMAKQQVALVSQVRTLFLNMLKNNE